MNNSASSSVVSKMEAGDLISQLKIYSLRRIVLNTMQGTVRLRGLIAEDRTYMVNDLSSRFPFLCQDLACWIQKNLVVRNVARVYCG